MVTDPVCRMEVDQGRESYSKEYEGRVYYFCSNECKEQLDKNPTEYTKARTTSHDHGAHADHFGSCCGPGMGGGWMGYLHLAMMVAFLLMALLLR